MSLSENVSNSHADEEVFAADDFSGGGAISSNRRRRAPMTVTPPAMLQFSQPLGATCDKSDALAVNARASVVDNPPTLSASLPPSLWRNADVTGAQKVSGERSRFGHQEENVMDCPSVRLIEEHLIGSREMRFCLCCGEVRCAEIRTAAEVLRSSLLERGVGKALYTGRKGDEVMAAAQAAVDPQYKDWTAPWIGGCCSTDDISDGNWNAGAEFGPSISKSLCTDDESWRSLPSRAPLLDQRHQEQQQTPLQATSRTKTRSGTLALAAHLAQLLWRAGAFVLAAIRGFHPLSPVLPKMYLRSYRVFEHDPEEGTVACSHHSSSTPAIDSVQARARWISCPHCRCRKSCRPSCPLRELGETSQPRSGHVLGHLKSASDPTTNRRSSSTCTEGGAPEDSNGASSGSSGQPSWIFAAPDEEDAYTTAEDDDGLVIQRPRAEVESDEDAGTGAPENGRVCVQRSNDVDTSAQILTRVPLSSTVKRIIIARKDKWNTISLSEALWRLVLPTFSAPFLTTTPVPSTDIALAARTTAAGDASLLGGDKSFEYVADSSTPSLRPGAVESTRSRVVTGAPSFTCFRGDVEEAIRQLDGAQLEVAKLRLQQVLAALNAEQVKREGQMKDSYKCSV
ncbi:hypothetical protein JKF63_05824 [Porcisia hertigi]|uniref:Uncharacterized protein n=1 Tax=Porcisia hertigi TaxID=2761500 RepID=A0A836IRE4_9TRYP|nr:hypothetical protein JKF63_05824 [Porcisia hertigi]